VTDEAGVLAQELVFVCFVSLFFSFLGEGCLWQEERYVLLLENYSASNSQGGYNLTFFSSHR